MNFSTEAIGVTPIPTITKRENSLYIHYNKSQQAKIFNHLLPKEGQFQIETHLENKIKNSCNAISNISSREKSEMWISNEMTF
jgi:hypothetical protein